MIFYNFALFPMKYMIEAINFRSINVSQLMISLEVILFLQVSVQYPSEKACLAFMRIHTLKCLSCKHMPYLMGIFFSVGSKEANDGSEKSNVFKFEKVFKNETSWSEGPR